MKRIIGLFAFLLAAEVPHMGPTAACPTLTPSGSISISSNYQTVQNLIITSNGDGIACDNHSGVTVQNVVILFSAGHGIRFNNCSNAKFSNVDIRFTAAPPSGQLTGTHYCIRMINSPAATVSDLLAQDCTGTYWQNSGGAKLSYIKTVNVRSGGGEYGTSFTFNNSGNFTLDKFYIYNDRSVAVTGDNIVLYGSGGSNKISNGLIDGNTLYIGNGIQAQNDANGNPSAVAVSNVDIINWCNGALGFNNTANASATNVRVRDSYSPCADGRAPSSNGTPFQTYNYNAAPNTTGTIFTGVRYYNLAGNPQLVYNSATVAVKDISQLNFTPQTPITPDVPH